MLEYAAANLQPTQIMSCLQVQSQPHGTYSYQQHFSRVGTAIALPAAAAAIHWVLLFIMGWAESCDRKKLKTLEAAKRSMVKELKVSCQGQSRACWLDDHTGCTFFCLFALQDMSRFDKIKSLIDKFDPDTQHLLQVRGVTGVWPSQPGSSSRQQIQHSYVCNWSTVGAVSFANIP